MVRMACVDDKGPEQSNNNIVLKLKLNTALKVRRIIDDLINTLDFPYKSEIAVSDILSSIYIVSVGFLKVKPKVNKKSEPRPSFIADLFAFRLVFPPAPKNGMVKFPGKGHFKRAKTG